MIVRGYSGISDVKIYNSYNREQYVSVIRALAPAKGVVSGICVGTDGEILHLKDLNQPSE